MTNAKIDRIGILKKGEKPDRVPVLGFVGGFAARLYGIPLGEFYTDTRKCFESQILAAELYGYEDSPMFGWADWGGWEFGGQIKFPDSYIQQAPQVVVPAIDKPGDAEKLKVPDPRVAGAYPNLMRMNRLGYAQGGAAKIFAGTVTTFVGSIIGKENLLRWYIKEPEALRTVYEKATEFILKAADMVIDEFGARNCLASFTAPLESNELIGPDLFERFGFVYLNRVVRELRARGVEQFSIHICGNHRRNLPIWARLPIPDRSIITVGADMNLLESAQAFGHRHIIAGNVPTTLLAIGSFDEVYTKSKSIIETGKQLPGGYILMPACELPVLTPPLNLYAMLKAAQDFGVY